MATVTRIPRPPTRTRFLPRDPRVEGPYRMTPQIALRLGILGAVLLFVFAVLFFRLWALQVLAGERYLAAAQNNQLRTIRIEAPRGPLRDHRGRTIVGNKIAMTVQVWPASLPTHRRPRVFRRLARVLNVPVAELQTAFRRQQRADPLKPVTLAEDIPNDVHMYLKERIREFPGLTITRTYLRNYPRGGIAPHLVGHVGTVTPDQVRSGRYRHGDKVGQSGIEAAYDRYLRGRAGLASLRVDSLGRPRGRPRYSETFRQGLGLRLTLDAKLQRAAELALVHGMQVARENKAWYANGGAVVALDPRDGAVRAMASSPTFDPRLYAGTQNPRALRPLLDPELAKELNYPGLNRAIAGLYPPGSTWKPVTALAAMRERLVSAYSPLSCTGSMEIDGTTFNNWNVYVNEAMTLPTALAQSCDTYFYQLGLDFYKLPAQRGSPLQKWASAFGFGKPTGLDVGGEEAGLLPTPEWRRKTYTRERYPDTWEIDQLWKTGDSVQLAIGQKDLLVTPLQMARFYALIANGGKLVTPHLVSRVEQPENDGAVRHVFSPPARQVNVDPYELRAVRQGLYEATHASYGTSYGTFGSFPVKIAGKTGTAEKVVDLGDFQRLMDQAWWCGYGPTEPTPELVVCVVIENGGHGGTAAAPAALKVFESYFGKKATTQTFVPTD
ncbi:MAG TPA: penicillin-binding protein 2 [Gaiellaceae bacterium]|jgi:penicillin-binding protein 2|nr:penicillin-binding protein 2 [Gaiellaceae bacterium]